VFVPVRGIADFSVKVKSWPHFGLPRSRSLFWKELAELAGIIPRSGKVFPPIVYSKFRGLLHRGHIHWVSTLYVYIYMFLY